ncbi:hypothetical protein [Teichococcus vastitatis]|uniref:Uncharacterized protein n=1 Tax=Teichococcus vastitatis TaxID=2307076 RepID=A0ABS9W0P4_9PROT|nr:hypothetical protein [Pseudoroseomonas vastitatis]MCI0752154.1 hypothetical protein [Pseudoroseomonas vastitatis]
MTDLQRRLSERFSALRDSRQSAVFFVEHGLDIDELAELRAAVRARLRFHSIDSGWWDENHLSLLVAATEVGYRYRGSGTDFWPLLDEELGVDLPPLGRQRIKDLFVHASQKFRGARPPRTAWAEAFHLIAWPITHALLPLEFHRSFAATLANLREGVSKSDETTLYRAVRSAAVYPTARFATFLEDPEVVVSLTRSLLRREGHDLSAEIIGRLSADLEADDVARRGVAVARSIQRAANSGASRAVHLPAATRIKGALQLRLANDSLLLEASFPLLDATIVNRLRTSLRRRRFAPQLWGTTARVASDQLLSGLPFPLKLTALPKRNAPLFTDLEKLGLEAQDLAVLHGFELELAPPQLFAVNAEGDVARQVHGSTITGHRKYWALIDEGDEPLRGCPTVGEIGPLRCLQLAPDTAGGARALAQLGFDVRRGVSVRFAGTPPIGREADIPSFVVGDKRVLVPQRMDGDETLVVQLNGRSAAAASATEVVRVAVKSGEQRLRVSGETASRDYIFWGVCALPPLTAPVRVELRSEERTVQALLGGRFGFVVDGAAPIDGLPLTVDLEVGGRVFTATGALGPLPQPVSSEHAVMKTLLNEEVRDFVSGAESATLRARVDHVAGAAWELERVVRPCWWQGRDEPQLLSEDGPLRFGVVSADNPVSKPVEGVLGSRTYLLAPIEVGHLEFGAAAPFTTLCIAPERLQLRDLAIESATRPRLERRRRGSRGGLGLEDLVEAYLRWSLAETRSAIGEIHRGQVTARIEEWMTEVCCGPEWTRAEGTLPRRSIWSILEQVCRDMSLGRDGLVGLSDEQETQVRQLAVAEIRRSLPTLWTRVGPPSDLGDDDYEVLDGAWSKAYEALAARYRARGQNDVADELGDADPGESPERWDEAFVRVRERVELRALAAMLFPSDSAVRLMALEVGAMTVDEVADELLAWATSARRSFAGAVPARDALKASYAVWVAPELVLTTDWRAAIDTLLVERSVARATRYLALKAREARWGGA